MLSPFTGHRVRAVPRALLRLILRTGALLAMGVIVMSQAEALAMHADADMDVGMGVGVGPSVTDVVEFTRIVLPRDGDPQRLQAQVSPDGAQVFIVTRKADTRADSNHYQVLLLDVRPQQLARGKGAAPLPVSTLVARDDNDAAYPALQDIRWAGPRTLVFRWKPRGRYFQVHSLDTVSRQLRQLSFAPLGVVSYAMSDDLRRLVYAAPQAYPAQAAGAPSVVVGNQSFWSVKFGQDDLRAQQRHYQYFVADSGSRRPARALGAPFAEANRSVPRLSVSPDGRWALLPRFEAARQLAWGKLYPLIAESTAKSGPALTTDPLGYFSRPGSYVVRRLVAYRLADGREQTVVDAPDDSLPAMGQHRSDRLWQDGGRSVVIAGTHLPLPADGDQGAAAAAGGPANTARASHLIEYWPDSGRWQAIAPLKGRLVEALAAPHKGQGFVVLDGGGQQRRFQRVATGGWREAPAYEGADAGTGGGAASHTAWKLRVAEGLNLPPDVVADGPDGRSVRLTELNPQFSADWGSMRAFDWTDAEGRTWKGGLMVPAGFVPGRPRGVVIQTYGFSAARFYLDGANTHDFFSSGFAGRAFLREGLLVLAMPVRAANGWPANDAAAIKAFMAGVSGAVEALVAQGLVDRERVGIMGWSATGERVLNQLTFSRTPIRSATIMDGDANTVFSMAVTYGVDDGIQARKERTNEGPPFGATLQRWVYNDPALHTDCVTAALRIETYGPWVLNNWDIYALLRRQYKPAEMVVIPGGTHGLLTPSERMVSLQGNVDWHSFWLVGGRRAEPLLQGETGATLNAQYTRWQQMAELKQADDARPACARKAGAR